MLLCRNDCINHFILFNKNVVILKDGQGCSIKNKNIEISFEIKIKVREDHPWRIFFQLFMASSIDCHTECTIPFGGQESNREKSQYIEMMFSYRFMNHD